MAGEPEEFAPAISRGQALQSRYYKTRQSLSAAMALPVVIPRIESRSKEPATWARSNASSTMHPLLLMKLLPWKPVLVCL